MSIKNRNHVVVKGNGSNPIIFSNGFGCDQTVWNDIIPAFEKEYQIILFDHIGTGSSDVRNFRENKYNVLDGYAEDIISICDYLELEDAIYVGHSVAAMMGIIAAQRSPHHFKKLVLVCPSPRHLNDGYYEGGFTPIEIEELLDYMDNDYEGWANHLSKVLMGNSDQLVLEGKSINCFKNISPDIANSFAQATFLSDSRAYLKDVKHPTLIIQTDNDPIVPLQSTEFTCRNIPHSQLVMIKETGHCPHISAPKAVINELQKFIC